MIDFIKSWIDQNEAYNLRENPVLKFRPYYDKRNELRGHKARWKDLTVYHTNRGQIILQGSVHKFANEGLHNYDDFTATRLTNTADFIDRTLRIRIKDTQLIRFEFGVNVRTGKPAKEIIEGLISYGKKQSFNLRKYEQGLYAEADLQQFRIKVYDKGAQFAQGENLLRFEIHSKKAAHFKRYGIKNFGDVLRPEVWHELRKALLDALDQILFIDPDLHHLQKNLSAKEREKLRDYLSREYWEELLTKGEKRRKQFYHHRKRLLEWEQKAGATTKAELKKAVAEKWDELTELHKGTDQATLGQSNNLYIGLNCPNLNIGDCIIYQLQKRATKERVCMVTGVKIEMQRAGSFHLSHTGLKHLLQNDPETFYRVRDEFLSDKWANEPLKTQIKELAHNIRNNSSNMRIRERKKYPSGQVSLWE